MTETHQYRNIFAEAFIIATALGWNVARPVIRAAQSLRPEPKPKVEAEKKKQPYPTQFRRLHRLAVPPLPPGRRLDDPRPQP